MATKFYCRNEKCDKYNEEIHFNSVSYVIRDGHLTPKERLVCDHCNQEVEMGNVKVCLILNSNLADWILLINGYFH